MTYKFLKLFQQILEAYPSNHRTIIEKLKISKSSYYWLRNEIQKFGSTGSLCSDNREAASICWILKRCQLKCLFRLPHIRLLLMKFKAKFKKVSGRAPSDRVIHNYLKEELGYSYKRGSARPLQSSDPKLKYLQAIFSWRILEQILDDRLVINIDESSYFRSIKANYSWLQKGKRKSIINSIWRWSVNMIFGLWTNGNWIGTLSSTTTTKSIDFCRFLLIVHKFVMLCLSQNVEDVTVTLDNARIHLTWKAQRVAHMLVMKVMWLPPYSPSLAPVEWVFRISKKRLASQRDHTIINFSKNYSKIAITDTLNKMNSIVGSRIWLRFIEESKECIKRVLECIKKMNKVREVIQRED